MNKGEVWVIYNISAGGIKAPCLFPKKEVIEVQKKPMPGKPGPKK
jgi:hypothetical protein